MIGRCLVGVRCAVVCLWTAACLTATSAQADPLGPTVSPAPNPASPKDPSTLDLGSDDAKQRALWYFELGLEQFREQKFDAALAEFVKSESYFSTSVALRNAALCLEQLGRQDEALEVYDDLLRKHGAKVDENVLREVQDAQRRLAAAVGTLELKVDVVAARISIDSRERGLSPIARKLYVRTGTRLLRVNKSGYAPFETKFIISSGEQLRMTVRLSRYRGTPTHVQLPDSRATSTLAAPPNTPPETQEVPMVPRYVAFTTLGVGATFLAIGTGFYFVARSKANHLEQACGGTSCEPGHEAEIRSFRRSKTLSYVGMSVGALGLGAGVVMLLTPYFTGKETSGWQPVVTPNQVGARAQF